MCVKEFVIHLGWVETEAPRLVETRPHDNVLDGRQVLLDEGPLLVVDLDLLVTRHRLRDLPLVVPGHAGLLHA